MKFNVGNCGSFTKTITEHDVYTFAGITGDFNPAHVNEVYAEHTQFKKRIAHGILSAGLISTVLGMYMPGPGTIYLEQELHFMAPVYYNDTITAKVEIIEIIKDKIGKLKTTCVNQNGQEVINGHATVMLPKED